MSELNVAQLERVVKGLIQEFKALVFLFLIKAKIPK